MPHILTANRLIDGKVVFHTAQGKWSEVVDEALLFSDMRSGETAYAAALEEATRVIDVALIDASREGERIIPARLRERIRAFGPTIKADHRSPSIQVSL